MRVAAAAASSLQYCSVGSLMADVRQCCFPPGGGGEGGGGVCVCARFIGLYGSGECALLWGHGSHGEAADVNRMRG